MVVVQSPVTQLMTRLLRVRVSHHTVLGRGSYLIVIMHSASAVFVYVTLFCRQNTTAMDQSTFTLSVKLYDVEDKGNALKLLNFYNKGKV